MRKEVLIAIIFGFGLGLIITFGVWSAQKTLNNQGVGSTNESESSVAGVTPTPSELSISLVILKPEDESIVNTPTVTVTGTTEPQAQITIVGEKDEQILETDEDGSFSAEINLVSGTNEITITSFSDKKEAVSKTIGVVYTTSTI